MRTVYVPTPEGFEHGRMAQTKESVRDEAARVREEAIRKTLADPLFLAGDKSFPASEKEMQEKSLKEKKSEVEELQEEKPLVREKISYGGEDTKNIQQSLFEVSEQKKVAFLDPKQEENHRIIGQLFATYWLVEFREQLFIIDQHAAHEKILYERTMARMRAKDTFLSQMLTPPIILSLSLREEEALNRHMDAFCSLGFAIEAFGGREYAVSALPADLYGVD